MYLYASIVHKYNRRRKHRRLPDTFAKWNMWSRWKDYDKDLEKLVYFGIRPVAPLTALLREYQSHVFEPTFLENNFKIVNIQ